MKKENCTNGKEHERNAERARETLSNAEKIGGAANVFRMLSEPSRLKIVLALTGGESCVYHLVEGCGGTQSGVSHQLRVLKDNKIVKARRVGQNVFYSIADEHILKMVEFGIAHSDCE